MRATVSCIGSTPPIQLPGSDRTLNRPGRQYTGAAAMLMKATSQSLTEQLSSRFAQRIRDRLLAPGARLPSVRQCAQQQGVSPSTVVAAYDQLLAQGLVEARKNRGFFVRESARAAPATSAPDVSALNAATGFASTRAPIDATA